MQKNIKVEVEDLSTVKKKIDVTLAAETVTGELKSAYQSLRANASVAGFRKGAVPLNIVKAKFGDHIQEEVTKKLIETSYPNVLMDKKLMPVEAPKVEIKTPKVEEGQEFTYSVTVEVNPQLDIQDYKGMELERKPVEVTEKDIDDGIQRIREARVDFKVVDRPAQEGDLVVVDFDAEVDGKEIPNSHTHDYPIIIGEKTILPGFDESLRGASKGDKRDPLIKFPDNYSEGGLGGKEATFHITLKEVKEKTLPEVTEEFAKGVGCDSLEALRAKVKEELTKVKETQEKERLKNTILDKLIEKNEFEVPESLVNRYYSVIINRVIENIKRNVFEPGDRELAPDALKDKYTNIAIRQVKEDIVLDHLAFKENVQVSMEETEEAVKVLAAQRNVSLESLMSRIEKEGALKVIQDGMKHEKVFDIILESSKTAA